ncbi:MAG TPA: HAD family hydrolase [Chthonomonadaceae bacterium]|nr:HAD family hydrolase [Chthonomonadaceae bacterium]
MATDLVFDFFGTLVHYTPGPFHTAPYTHTHDYLRQQGFDIPYEAFTAAFEIASDELEGRASQTGQEYHMEELGRRFFRVAFDREASEAVVVGFVSAFLKEWNRGILYIDSLRPFLDRLATTYRLSVLSNTNYPPLIHTHLSAMGVADLFAQVFTSVEIGVRKPSPVIFEHALERLGVSASDVVYVGDSYAADYQGASAAGIRCILIDCDGRYPEVPFRVASLFDLEHHV